MVKGMNTAIIVQARIGSTRLPKKILLPWNGKTVLGEVLERCMSTGIKTILAVPYEDIGLALFHEPTFVGSSLDVLDRYYNTALYFNIQTIIRITADCPFVNPDMIRDMIEQYEGDEYYSNCHPVRVVSRGYDVEIFPFKYLKKAWNEAKDTYHREHVTSYMYRNVGIFRCRTYEPRIKVINDGYNYSIDTIEDYRRLKRLVDRKNTIKMGVCHGTAY